MDYQSIISGITFNSIIHLMEELGSPVCKETDEYICFKTICHNIDIENASSKLYFYKNTKIFMCYTCCGTMSIFKFLEHYYNTRQIEYDWYSDIYEVVLNCSTYTHKETGFIKPYIPIRDNYQYKEVKELPEYPKGVLDCFIKYYPPEWLQEGISKEAMDRFNILYSISQNKIIIPHYDINNRLVGIRGRALDEWEIENIGKYAPVKIEQIWYKHPLSLNLYGLNINKENIKKNHICYIVEAEKSVLEADSFSIPNCCVAICGSNFNKYGLKLLLKECAPSEIVLCLDNEEKPNEDKYFNKLYSICKKYSNYCNFSFVYDRKHLTDYKDSPTDKGEAIFKELLKGRVKVK